MLEGSVYVQPFETTQPMDELVLRLNVPRPDPRFDTEGLRNREEHPDSIEGDRIPARLQQLPGQSLAQVLTPRHEFNAVGAQFCNWATSGSGVRLRLFLWQGSYDASVAGPVLAQTTIADVPDNRHVFVVMT